ncbi:hypothetical protein [Algoriphagus sp.]
MKTEQCRRSNAVGMADFIAAGFNPAQKRQKAITLPDIAMLIGTGRT